MDNELQVNFRVSADEIKSTNKDKEVVRVRPLAPPITIPVKRIHRKYTLNKKKISPGTELGLKDLDYSKYMIIHETRDGL